MLNIIHKKVKLNISVHISEWETSCSTYFNNVVESLYNGLNAFILFKLKVLFYLKY